ncbi:hypothetical protein [Undibacterium parvum]|uniref:Pilus assembly protein PilO n=1 Tax=Undibacterium parvum TaxID=401471 RepID=A0A3S9HMS8_9BURK|nr:hypothetical protein [Undibacterium parvum]AZP13389.1 hypothetical protein EJN92_16145 [Undibacterium parvum]
MIVALLVCLLAVLILVGFIPHLKQQLVKLNIEQQVAKSDLQKTALARPIVPVLSVSEQNRAKFFDVLGETAYAEQQVKTLFTIAESLGLSLNQGEYKSNFDKNSNTYVYQIQLPVKGPYLVIRQFCEKTLLAIPFASLDEMSFKREAIGSNILEAKLRFSLYLGDLVPKQSGHEKGAVPE